LFSKRNLQISPVRGQGERSRRYAVLRYASVCCTSFLAGLWSYIWPKSNSPFGAWVVCFYRTRHCRAPFR